MNFRDLELYVVEPFSLSAAPGDTSLIQWEAIAADENLAEDRFIRASDLIKLIRVENQISGHWPR